MTDRRKSMPNDPTHEKSGEEGPATNLGPYAGPLASDEGNEESQREAPNYSSANDHDRPAEAGRYQTGWSGVGGDLDREDNRGKGPKGYKRSDERIHEDVCERLMSDRDVDASDIEVSVSDSEVTLNGAVRSKREKRCAEDCADAITGVTHVQNNLRARYSTSGKPAATGQGRDRNT